ncbi:MAG TPA: hypothetical protein VLK33_20930 [Terriglobales bacterium]|nr:hypothetical protein [Terriglobales bacterium]
MLKKIKKRWWTRKTLGVLLAKLILSGATDLAALTVPAQPVPHFVSIHSSSTIR